MKIFMIYDFSLYSLMKIFIIYETRDFNFLTHVLEDGVVIG